MFATTCLRVRTRTASRIRVIPEQVWLRRILTRLRRNAENFRTARCSGVYPRWLFFLGVALLSNERFKGRGVVLAAIERRREKLLLSTRVHGTNTPEPRV
jgi:hypothetical protein